MPRLVTMANIVQRAQRRCDMENNGLIDSTVGGEWYALASEQYAELVALVAGTGMRYFDASQQFTTTGSSNALTMPADHFETIGLDHIINTTTGQRRALMEIMAQERARWSGLSGGDAVAYELVASSFLLYPTPPSGQVYELRYIPQPTDLTTLGSSSTVDLISVAGEKFMSWGMAVNAIAKAEGDPQLAMAERDKAAAQLVEWATERSLNTPRRRIVQGDNEWLGDDYNDPGGWWSRR